MRRLKDLEKGQMTQMCSNTAISEANTQYSTWVKHLIAEERGHYIAENKIVSRGKSVIKKKLCQTAYINKSIFPLYV